MNHYHVISSSTSSCGHVGLRPSVNFMSRADIIGAAQDECLRHGTSLEEIAGVEWVENDDGDFNPARVLADEEIFEAACKKLGDDNRLFEVFLFQDAQADAEFMAEAKAYGLNP